MSNEKKKLIKQLLRFGVVGGIAFLIDYVLLYCFTEFLHIDYLVSAGISFTISLIFNYVASTKWVFDVTKKQGPKEITLFVILSVIGLGINQLIMYLMVDKLSIHYMITKLFATGVVMVWNFVTRKIFLEK